MIEATGKPLIVNALGGDDTLIQFGWESAFGSGGFRFLGGQGTDKLSFENYISPLAWNVSALGSGSVTPAGQTSRGIHSVEFLDSGDGADEFRLLAGNSSMLGRIDGGGGTDLIRVTGDADMRLASNLVDGRLTVSGPISQRDSL